MTNHVDRHIGRSGNPTDQLAAASAVPDQLLSQAVEEYLRSSEQGRPIDIDGLVDKYSDVADELRSCIETLDFMRNVAPQLAEDSGAGRQHADATIQPLANLGDFRIIREIGRGGMGVVYEAEQLSLGRRMALKVLPLAATLSIQQLERFKNEARLAASLKHPHIVGVHSVGVERGVHYYAMELVEGSSLAQAIAVLGDNGNLSHNSQADVCDTAETSPIAALSTARTKNPQEYFRRIAHLVTDAADALDYAHDQGIVHRDIKPGNLLLDHDGKVYVTDFGLARLEADVGVTMTGDLLGTLRYMSPEQAAGKPGMVDHRTDIHALGATLYELLVMRPTYEGGDRATLLRHIAEDAPPALRQVDTRIPHDLETITAKALEKEPGDRYQSAGALAADLRAFVDDRPITAKPPSVVQRIARWSRRHQGLVAATMGFLLLLSITTTIATTKVWREQQRTQLALEAAEQQRELAEASAAQAEQSAEENKALVEFFVDDLLGAIDPEMAQGREVTVAEVLQQAENKIDVGMQDQPLLEASIRHSLGRTYQALAKWDAAEKHLRRALELYKQRLGEDRLTFRTQYLLGKVLHDRGNLEPARKLLEDTRAQQRKTLGELDEDYLNTTGDLGNLYCFLDRHDEAETLYQEAYENFIQVLGPEHEETLALQFNLANMLMFKGRYAEAQDAYQQVLDVSERIGLDNIVLAAKQGLSAALASSGEHTAALPLREQILVTRRKVLGEDHPNTLEAMGEVASALYRLGNKQKANDMYESAAQRAYELRQWPTLVAITWDAIARVSPKEKQAKMSFLRSIALSHIESEASQNNAFALFELGNGYLHGVEQSDKLMRLRNEAEALLPKMNAETRAMLLAEIGKASRAIKLLQVAIKESPADHSIVIRLALLQASRGDREGFGETVEGMSERFGTTSNGVTPLNFAQRMVQQHHLAKIRKSYKFALEMLPESEDRLAVDVRAILQAIEGINDRQRALHCLIELLNSNPEVKESEESTAPPEDSR